MSSHYSRLATHWVRDPFQTRACHSGHRSLVPPGFGLRHSVLAVHVGLAILIVVGGNWPVHAFAAGANAVSDSAADAVRHYAIPAGLLSPALIGYSSQSGAYVAAPTTLTEGRNTAGLNGDFKAERALAVLLSGTGLRAVGRGHGQFVLQELPTDKQADVMVLPATNVIGEVEDSLTEIPSTADPRVTAAQGAVTVTAATIQNQQATNLEEALRKVTAVQIDEVQGAQGVSISVRGQSGDAVSVRVDGAPKNRSLINHNGNNDRDTTWLDVDMYQSITAIPGAEASVYGTGSTGGVVLLSTKDPEDIIKPGRDWGAAVRYGHTTNGMGDHYSTDLAKKFSDLFSANVTLSSYDVDAYKDANGDRPYNGGTGNDTFSYLAKGVFTPSDAHRLEFSVLKTSMHYSRYDEDATDTSLLDTTRYRVMDRTASVEYSFRPADQEWIDLKLRGSRSWTDNKSRDVAAGETGYADSGSVTTDYFEVENTTLIPQSAFISHRFRYGVDYTKDDVDMTYTDEVAGGTLQATREQKGAYLIDSVSLGDSLNVTGTVRYDTYNIQKQGDSINGEDAISPTLSMLWRPFQDTALKGLGLTGMVGKGYKAPTVTNLYGNGGFGIFTGTDPDGDGIYTNSTYGCDEQASLSRSNCWLANENLKGEHSKSYEIGFVYESQNLFQLDDSLRTKINYIHQRIQDRISQETVGQTQGGFNVVQYQNVDDAKILGWEFSMNYDSKYFFADFSTQIMKGYDMSDHSRLEDVNPRSVAAGIGTYFNGRKGRVGVDMHSRARLYIPSESTCTRGCTDTIYPSYQVYDLYGDYKVNDHLRLQARLANVTNKLYTKTSYTSTDAVADDINYYAGRNLKLDLSYEF